MRWRSWRARRAVWKRRSARPRSTVSPKAYASGMELIADPDIDLVLNLDHAAGAL